MLKNLLLLYLLGLILTNCAWFGGSWNNNSSSKKVKLPSANLSKAPGGVGADWRYMGITKDNQITDEIDANSIENVNINSMPNFIYRDRKTIVNPLQYNYPPEQPQFKYLISSWQMNCKTKQYLLNSTTLFNAKGQQISQNSYINNVNVNWLQIDANSFAQLQFNFVCLNQNRNLGY
jgi:hypothetical protein